MENSPTTGDFPHYWGFNFHVIEIGTRVIDIFSYGNLSLSFGRRPGMISAFTLGGIKPNDSSNDDAGSEEAVD